LLFVTVAVADDLTVNATVSRARCIVHELGDDEHGVLPHFPMNDAVLREYGDRADPLLAYALDRL
jgi:hypothetical protein